MFYTVPGKIKKHKALFTRIYCTRLEKTGVSKHRDQEVDLQGQGDDKRWLVCPLGQPRTIRLAVKLQSRSYTLFVRCYYVSALFYSANLFIYYYFFGS